MSEANYKEVARQLAEAIVAHDYSAAHQTFASWLQAAVTPARLQQLIETELREVAEAAELEEMRYPREFQVDTNPLSFEEWRDDDAGSRDYDGFRRCLTEIPPEMTTENYHKRLVVQFMPGEDEVIDVDAWLDFWMIVVEENGRLCIGYFEIADPD